MENKRINTLQTSIIFSLILVIAFSFLGCSQISQKSYREYLSLIPILELPFSLNCSEDFELPDQHVNSEAVALHKPEGAILYGRFKTDSDFTIFIYLYPGDILLPVITTGSKENNKISEVSPLNEECWQRSEDDPIGFCNCDIRIDEDLNIEVVKRFDNKGVVARYSIDEKGIITVSP